MVTSASTGLSAVQVTAIVLGYLSMIPFAISFQVNKRKFNILMLAIGCLITAASCICECIARNDLVVFLTPAVIFAMLPLAYIVLYFKPTKDWATFRFWPLILCGLVAAGYILWQWIDRGFGELGEERLAVAAATLMVVGVQVVFTSFLLSILGLRRER